jgi:hypothetical protein
MIYGTYVWYVPRLDGMQQLIGLGFHLLVDQILGNVISVVHKKSEKFHFTLFIFFSYIGGGSSEYFHVFFFRGDKAHEP